MTHTFGGQRIFDGMKWALIVMACCRRGVLMTAIPPSSFDYQLYGVLKFGNWSPKLDIQRMPLLL